MKDSLQDAMSPGNLPMMEKDASVFMDEMQGERQGALSSLLSSSISSWGYLTSFFLDLWPRK